MGRRVAGSQGRMAQQAARMPAVPKRPRREGLGTSGESANRNRSPLFPRGTWGWERKGAREGPRSAPRTLRPVCGTLSQLCGAGARGGATAGDSTVTAVTAPWPVGRGPWRPLANMSREPWLPSARLVEACPPNESMRPTDIDACCGKATRNHSPSWGWGQRHGRGAPPAPWQPGCTG